MSQQDSVVAVLSLFNPPPEVIERVRRLRRQVDKVVVVDDGSPSPDEATFELLEDMAQVIRLEENKGIAAALNAGIQHARALWDPAWVLTLDQDSEIGDGFIANAQTTAERAKRAGIKVGAVTPETHNGTRIDMLPGNDEFGQGFDPMQSGTLISTSALDHVGLLDESLFIDAVDSEFTARLRQHGYSLITGDGCDLSHTLGQARPMKVLGLRVKIAGRELNVYYHAPFRVYYMARNSVRLTRTYLLSQPAWILKRVALESIFHLIRITYGPNRMLLLKAIVLGIRDGLLGRQGRIPADIQDHLSPS
ncbi:glycosyltransferase [Arthrobacter sp. SAFR-179]|uniref:glycosyltransferase n=1 Tax=Arthrobacter sp. SAFR-179 TaxID=3387279 RepID=UPI003F7CB071